MNFQKIPPVNNAKQLLDLAFSQGRVKGNKKLHGSWIEIIQRKESLKLDVIKDNLVTRLQKIKDSFPYFTELDFFYTKLLQLTLDYPLYRKSIGAIEWAMEKVRHLHREYMRRINRSEDQQKIKQYSREFYGRISSVLKQIDLNLKYLEESRQIMRTFPDVKQEMFTVAIYGFPNVGKSTLLNKLTGTRAETAAYAFTTKTINAGYFTIAGQKVQVFDLPGTLARDNKMNNIELQAELVRSELADVIVYVFDLSGEGYPLKKQEELFKRLKGYTIFIYLSKTDLIEPEIVKEFSRHYHILNFDRLKTELARLAQEKAVEDARLAEEARLAAELAAKDSGEK